jgi:hypothetical protein
MKPALQVRLFDPRSVETLGDADAVPTGTTNL